MIKQVHAYLKAHYPDVFTVAVPLAVGIHREILEAENIPKWKLTWFLRWWCRRYYYAREMSSRTSYRHSLSGEKIEPVSEMDRDHARQRMHAMEKEIFKR